MRSIRTILILGALLTSQQLFANEAMMGDDSDSKPCATIAHACLSGGYTEHKSKDKRFWQDCMKPVLLGKTVAKVKVDGAVVKSCRDSKIEKMKKEIDEFSNVK